MNGSAAMTPEEWISVGITVVLMGIGFWRWKVVNQPPLTDERCEELSALVVEDLFGWAPEAGEPVLINPRYWREAKLSDSEWIYLCRWMNSRGLTSTPNDWGWLAIIFGSPPSALALTQKSWGLAMGSRRQPDISIGDGNGPINIGGHQTVISGQSLSSDDMRALVEALRHDASTLPEPEASSVLAAANSLQGAADGRLPETSPEVTGALTWVRRRVSEAVGNAGGAALWAGTVAVAEGLGWFS